MPCAKDGERRSVIKPTGDSRAPGPNSSYPSGHSGKKNVVFRSVQHSWLRQWQFLHYDVKNDLAYCHTCVMDFKQKKMKASTVDPAFVNGLLF